MCFPKLDSESFSICLVHVWSISKRKPKNLQLCEKRQAHFKSLAVLPERRIINIKTKEKDKFPIFFMILSSSQFLTYVANWSFPLITSLVKVLRAGMFTFTKEVFNGKLQFWYSVIQIQRRFQNKFKHLRWIFFQKYFMTRAFFYFCCYFCKKLQPLTFFGKRCLAGFWMRLIS